jgi:tetratricopeptide (TPR) repeat protein
MNRTIIYYCILIIVVVTACESNPKPARQKHIVTADEHLQDLELAISNNPDSARLYEIIIDTLTNRRQFVAATEWCNKLIRRGADSNYYYWFIKGDIFRRGQLYDSAIKSYQTYLRKFPDDEQVLLNLANTYAEAGNRNAVDLANMIAARIPNREMRSEVSFIKGVYFNQVRQYSEARKWLDSTILLNYTFYEAYMEKGYSYYDEGKYKEAYETFSRLSDVNNGYADAWYWMAKSEEALGRNDDAINDYEHAYSLDHNITEATSAIDRLRKPSQDK